MANSAEGAALSQTETEIRDAIWERIGNQAISELPERLGFDPVARQMGSNRIVFEDSGVEVTLWVNSSNKISMVNVRRL